jgi:hypothetical protein
MNVMITKSVTGVINDIKLLRARILEAYAAHFEDDWFSGPWSSRWRLSRLTAWNDKRGKCPSLRASRLCRHYAKLIMNGER